MQGEAWFWVAVGCNVAGYATYLTGLRRKLVDPNRASWLIWSAATAIEALTYSAVNTAAPQAGVLLISSALCLAVTLAIWRRSAWSAPSATETGCMAACLLALILWIVFREAFWAHMLVVVAVPVSFWPTWASVAADRTRERSPAWGLWTVGDLATLLVAARGAQADPVGEYSYLLVELVCHASVWIMIGLATINPLRSLGTRRGGFYVLDVAGFRAEKRTSLVALADEVVARVRASGADEKLEPMPAFERKVVHDAVAAAGLESESEGEEPRRRVVVFAPEAAEVAPGA